MPEPAQSRKMRVRGETEQRRRVLQIAKRLSATLGADFFQSIVKYLSTTFQTDCTYLGELTRAPEDEIRTLAVCDGQELAQNFGQPLSGTASGQVVSDGSYACSRDAKLLFPLDHLIQTLEAEGFLGIRLSDSAGQAAGLLAMVSRKSFNNIQVVKSVLEAFVPRAAAELERKRSEDLHRQNEERLQAFIFANPDAMWRIEIEQPVSLGLPEEEQIDWIYRFGYLAECNEALAKLAGVSSSEELVGCRFEEFVDLINPDSREELRAAVRSGFRPITLETTLQDRAGEQVYRLRSQFGIVEDGALRRIWGTTRDITELRRTELSLAASERRFREVLEKVQLPAVILNLQGTVTFANEYFLRLSERSMEEISTLTWLEGVVASGEPAMWQAAVGPDHSAGHASVHFTGTIVPREGPPRVIAWDTTALQDKYDHWTYLAAIGRDVTHERALEMELRQAQKLESIGHLASGLAHDFNNLLSIVLGSAELLLEETSETDSAYGNLSAIKSAAMQCAGLTGQLLAFGRKQALQPQIINLNDVIVRDESIIRTLAGIGNELIFALEAPIGLVYADPAQIQRVLANLITNARDAMPYGGTLTVATSNLTIGEENAAFPGIKAGIYVRLSVWDSGVGLTDEIRTHIFEPFFTTKAPGQGTGLGLSTVYGIVAQSGGHIVVNSEPGQGARFDILLPVVSESE